MDIAEKRVYTVLLAEKILNKVFTKKDGDILKKVKISLHLENLLHQYVPPRIKPFFAQWSAPVGINAILKGEKSPVSWVVYKKPRIESPV